MKNQFVFPSKCVHFPQFIIKNNKNKKKTTSQICDHIKNKQNEFLFMTFFLTYKCDA